MKKITIFIGSVALLLGSYQVHAQESQSATSPKKKRMFFYPSKPDAPVVQALVVSPNPANALVEIQVPRQPVTLNGGKYHLQVIDKQGIPVIAGPWQGEKLDVTGLAAGMYVVTLRNGRQTFTQKLVVVKE